MKKVVLAIAIAMTLLVSILPGTVKAIDGQWSYEQIDQARLPFSANVPNGQTDSIDAVIDSNDVIHVCYIYMVWYADTVNPHSGITIKYANNAGGVWHTETVSVLDQYSNVDDVAISLDSNGGVHIAYGQLTCDSNWQVTGGSINYATKNDGNWNVQTIANEVSQGGLAMAIDSSDVVHIAYVCWPLSDYNWKSSTVNYLTNTGGGWNIQMVEDSEDNATTQNGFAGPVSLALDSENNVHLCYCSKTAYINEVGTAIDGPYSIHYANNQDFVWTVEAAVIGEVGVSLGGACIAIDSEDKVHMAYISISRSPDSQWSSNLMYGVRSADAWSYVPVLASPQTTPIRSLSMVLDSKDKAHLSWGGKCTMGVEYEIGYFNAYTTNGGGSWIESQKSYTGADTPARPIILLDSKVHVHNVYWVSPFPRSHTFLHSTFIPLNTAPTVDSLSVPVDPVNVNNQVTASATFTDPDSGDIHAAIWTWSDGTTSEGVVDESAGTVTGTHIYPTAGIYTVSLAVTDSKGESASATAQTYIVVYDPSGGFVTGGGWIYSPAGAYAGDPALTGKAIFGFVAKYQKGASVPSGNTEFQFSAGDLNYHSASYEWLVVNQGGTNAQFKGDGTINGAAAPNGQNYKFMIWAGDGSPDTFRIKIWWEDVAGEHIVYDNGAQQAIAGGSIVIHTN